MTVAPATAEGAPPARTDVVLEVDSLAVDIRTRDGVLPVVTDVSFDLHRGETLGIVGESGCGKTVTALALLGILPPNGRISAGSIRLEGRDLVGLGRGAMEDVRGRRIAMVFQDPFRCLDPAFTVGDQIGEVARRHLGLSRRDARAKAIDLMQDVGIRDPQRRVDDYPHMFSGGMAQRVMIAMALTGDPTVLVADEPTTALDVTVQSQVLGLLQRLRDERGLSVVLITHDLGVVAQVCDRMAVMYGGQVIETAEVLEGFHHPQHPYLSAMLQSVPTAAHREERFGTIRGVVPPPSRWPAGCRFHPRCDHFVAGRCDEAEPPMVPIGPDRAARCVRVAELELEGVRSGAR